MSGFYALLFLFSFCYRFYVFTIYTDVLTSLFLAELHNPHPRFEDIQYIEILKASKLCRNAGEGCRPNPGTAIFPPLPLVRTAALCIRRQAAATIQPAEERENERGWQQ